jgi:RND family efflux transporter MFP subunit
VLLVLLIAGVVIAVVGIVQRKHARSALAAETNALAAPDVTVSKAKSGSPNSEIVLPGNIIAFEDAPIYARTNGYLSRWYFDIGARVHKGQLLAVISTPEVDQQLLQARADLATAESNAGFAKNTAQRYQNLLQSDAVSRQDTDNFTTQAQSSNTTVKSQQANVQRLEQLQSFERVYAPFNGVVTSRSIDIGQLIDQGAAKELFHLSSTDTLRVYVNVPQVYSRDALPGAKAQLTFAEYPGRSFEGNLVRTARAIDLVSRTLLVEVDVDNRSGQLAPGAYTEVHLKVGRPVTTVVIPVSALLFRKEGLRVVSVQHTADGDTAKLIPIAVGHDDGDTVQVVSGLDPDTPIVTDPPDSVIDGEKLHVLQPDQAQKAEQGQ